MHNPFQVSQAPAPPSSASTNPSQDKRGTRPQRPSGRSRASTRGRGGDHPTRPPRGSSRGRGGSSTRGAPSFLTPTTAPTHPTPTLQYNSEGVPINNPGSSGSTGGAPSQRGHRQTTRGSNERGRGGRGRTRGRGSGPREREAQPPPPAFSLPAPSESSAPPTTSGRKRRFERGGRGTGNRGGGPSSQPRDEHSSRDKNSILPTETIVQQLQGTTRGRATPRPPRGIFDRPRPTPHSMAQSSDEEEDSEGEAPLSSPASVRFTFRPTPSQGTGDGDRSEGSEDEHAEYEEDGSHESRSSFMGRGSAPPSSLKQPFSLAGQISDDDDDGDRDDDDGDSSGGSQEDTGPLRFMSSQFTPPSSPAPMVVAASSSSPPTRLGHEMGSVLQRKSMRHVHDAMDNALGSTFVPRGAGASMPREGESPHTWQPPSLALMLPTIPGQPHLQGTCTSKCSMAEFQDRMQDFSFSSFERDPLTNRPSFDLAVAQYSRTASNTEEQIHKLRTPTALLHAGQYLLEEIADRDRPRTPVDSAPTPLEVTNFIADRLRAIHKEMSTQGLAHPTLVGLLECAIRFLLVSVYRNLQSGDQSNTVEWYKLFTNAFLTLRDRAYPACRAAGVSCPNESEMHSYFLLYQSQEVVFQSMARPDLLAHPSMRLARQVCVAIETRNYVRFFALLEQCPLVMRCLVYARHAHKMRERALHVLAGAARGNPRATYRVEDLTSLLRLDDENQTIGWMEEYGLLPKGNDDEIFSWPSGGVLPTLSEGKCLLSSRSLTLHVHQHSMYYLSLHCPYLHHASPTTPTTPTPTPRIRAPSPVPPPSPPLSPSPSAAQQVEAQRQAQEQKRLEEQARQQQAELERVRQLARQKQEEEEAHRARMEATKKRQAELEQQFQARQKAWEAKQQEQREAQHQVDQQLTHVRNATETYRHYLAQQAADQELYHLRLDCVRRYLLATPARLRLAAWKQWRYRLQCARAFQEAMVERGKDVRGPLDLPIFRDPLPTVEEWRQAGQTRQPLSFSLDRGWKDRMRQLMAPLDVSRIVGPILAQRHPQRRVVYWKMSVSGWTGATPTDSPNPLHPLAWLQRKLQYPRPHPPMLDTLPHHLWSVYESSLVHPPTALRRCKVAVSWMQPPFEEHEDEDEEEEERPSSSSSSHLAQGVQGLLFVVHEEVDLSTQQSLLHEFLASHVVSPGSPKPLCILHCTGHSQEQLAQALALPHVLEAFPDLVSDHRVLRLPMDIYGHVLPSAEVALRQAIAWQAQHSALQPSLHGVNLVDVVGALLEEELFARCAQWHTHAWPHPQSLIRMYRRALEWTYRTLHEACPPSLDWPVGEFIHSPPPSRPQDMGEEGDPTPPMMPPQPEDSEYDPDYHGGDAYAHWNGEGSEQRLQAQLQRLMIPSLPEDVLSGDATRWYACARAYAQCVGEQEPALRWLTRYVERLNGRHAGAGEDGAPYPWSELVESVVHGMLNAHASREEQVFFFLDDALPPSRPALQCPVITQAQQALQQQPHPLEYVVRAPVSPVSLSHVPEDPMEDEESRSHDDHAEEEPLFDEDEEDEEEEEEDAPPMKRQKRASSGEDALGREDELMTWLHAVQEGEAHLHACLQEAILPTPLP